MWKPLGHLRKFERRELTWLLMGFSACVLLLVFIALAGEVAEGDTQAFDVKVVQALRNPIDPADPVGPYWLQRAVEDITVLGGPTVLGLVLAAVVGFLWLQARYQTALFVTITVASGELVSWILKHTFNRPRPSVVPNLHIMSPSFPSGHAMESAVLYLTLGAVLMRVADRRITKVYIWLLAVFLTTSVGISRVYLGVHYPTDVVAGWIVGFIWASLCWVITQQFEAPAIEAERQNVAENSQ